MLLLLAEYLQQFYKGFGVFQYLTLRGILSVLTALSLSLAGALDDPYLADPPDRPGRAQRRSAVAPVEEGHPDHGRRPDPYRHRHQHSAVGGSFQPLRVGGAGRYPAVRCHRLGGRLPQGDREELPRPAEPLEVLLAVGVRHRRRRVPLYDCRNPDRDHPDRADAEERRDPVGHLLRGPDLLRHRRFEQCGEPHRRSRRPGDHADGNGCRRAGHLLLPVRAT